MDKEAVKELLFHLMNHLKDNGIIIKKMEKVYIKIWVQMKLLKESSKTINLMEYAQWLPTTINILENGGKEKNKDQGNNKIIGLILKLKNK